jgi:serralysin
VRAVLSTFSAVTNVTFSELTETANSHGDLRFAESSAPSTAWAYYPSPALEGGDVWFNRTDYNAPVVGNYAYVTAIHEIGHALGLKHPHVTSGGFNSMPLDQDYMAYTVMTYRSYQGLSTSNGYTNGSVDFAQSLMMYDIAALQRLYGADYDTNSGNTRYSWSATTGRMSIDGATQAMPAGNRIFMTVWDGGGNDTYDFSNYATNLTIDLAPGGWITLSSAQLARLHANGSVLAPGNIANALLFEGDTRSLIENAIGGSGVDTIFGNAASNDLQGGAGDDAFYDQAGNDIISGDAGRDYIDGGAGIDTAVFSGNFSAYSVYQASGGAWLVEDLRNGSPDGCDYLLNMEYLRFADGDRNLAALVGSGIIGTDGSDSHQGTGSDDTIDARGGNDDVFGKAGNDTITGGAGRDYVDGGAGTDTAVFTGNFSAYSVYQASGGAWVVEDLRNGSPDGCDYLINMEYLRFADGDRNLAVLVGSGIIGTDGSDSHQGTGSDDTIDARGGNDDVYGKAGNDTITGGAGRDYIDGGAGTDTAVFTGNFSAYSVYQTSGSAWVVEDLRNGSPDGCDYLINMEYLRFADGDRNLAVLAGSGIVGTDGSDSHQGTGSDDTIDARGGDDDVYGKAGNDTITGGAGRDYIDGGVGTDTAVFTGNFSAYSIYQTGGGAWVVEDLRNGSPDGCDYLVNMEYLRFADGDRNLAALVSSSIVGTDGSDSFLQGTGSDDTIDARAGDDDVYGKAGNDTITGGAGRDYIDGGAGADTAVFAGSYSAYSVHQTSGGAWVVEDLRNGSPDGCDYLLNIDTLRFADGDHALSVLSVHSHEPENLPHPIFDDGLSVASMSWSPLELL